MTYSLAVAIETTPAVTKYMYILTLSHARQTTATAIASKSIFTLKITQIWLLFVGAT